MLDELHLLLQLWDVQLILELSKLQHFTLFEEDGELHEVLLDSELFDGQLEESLLLVLFDEQLKLLLLFEILLKLELSMLLEQHELVKDDEGELLDELLDVELTEGLLEEKLLGNLLDEQLKLMQLLEIQLYLDDGKLLEQHGLIFEEGEQLQDELLDAELFDGEEDEKLHEFLLDELHSLLMLVEIQLKLEDFRLLEQHGLFLEEEIELQEELLDVELLERKLEE